MDFGNKCILIVRVSTSPQDYSSQVEQLRNVASSKGLTVVHVVETKESGFRSIDMKEGFKDLKEKLIEHDCHIVLVTELSRLARRKFILETIKQYFVENMIQLWVQDMRFWLLDDKGEVSMTADIIFSVFSALAENEMHEKKARTARVITDLQLQGYSIMGPTPFGYEKKMTEERVKGKKRNQVVVNEKTAEQVRAVYDMYLNGINGDMTRCSLSCIHAECIARGYDSYFTSERNINKALKYRPYTGQIEISKNIRKNPEYWTFGDTTASKYIESSSQYKLPQIIDVETFNAVQEKMKKASTRLERDSITEVFSDKSRLHNTLLRKMIVCPGCGEFYLGDYRIQGKYLACGYRCWNHTSHGAFQLSMRITDAVVWAFGRGHAIQFREYVNRHPEMININAIQERIANIVKEIERQKQIQGEMAERFVKASRYDKTGRSAQVYEEENAKIEREIQNLQDQKEKEEEYLNQVSKLSLASEITEQTIEYIESNRDEMRDFLQRIISKIFPRYHDSQYVVLEIVLQLKETEYSTMDLDDLNVDPNYSHRNYIIIDQKDNWCPKVKFLCGPCLFDSDRAIFSINGKIEYSLPQVFEDDEDTFFQTIEYKSLDLYGADGPKGIPISPTTYTSRKEIGKIGLSKRWGKDNTESID